MKVELIEHYLRNSVAYTRGERTTQQWQDVCLWILAEIMDEPENRKVLERLADEANS
jgi:hypothetical protein